MAEHNWTFFSNHGHVMIAIGCFPHLTYREIALNVGITERAAQKIVADLLQNDFLTIEKVGRNNHYHVNHKKNLKHPIELSCEIGEIIQLIKKKRKIKEK